ncbi:paraquat-inducible protein A [Olivibacter sp. SDN3]|uniref:paraquat-inducible protein A n=1 Tax=Olivibacter sp. SDN3 TaxID=2764720 RepID=UPI0016510E88|nr:paraquat-inducible protein A [Olivibacter sp. SDN3]QNL51773.1 paraquat-inducible protein A [Olivibacter sp. SDN3]
MSKKAKQLLNAVLSIVLLAMVYCGYREIHLSRDQQEIMEDYSTVNSIAFGLLSIDEWEDKITKIVDKQIENFTFTEKEKADLQKEIEKILHSMIDKAIEVINEKQKSIGGKIRKAAVNLFVNEEKLHEQVPTFAETIVNEITKPSTKKTLKNLAEGKLEDFTESTFDSSMTAQRKLTQTIFKKYEVDSVQAFEKKANTLFENIRFQSYTYAAALIVAVLLFLILWRLFRNKKEVHQSLFIFSLLAACIILIVGVSSVMIELEARLETVDFHLLGEHLVFDNQILFFQSKSILDVVWILVKNGEIDSIVIGFLIFTFSVLFPSGKLICSGIYLLKDKIRANKIISFFAFKSGKWSMADVMVVAIMMSYIGLNSILNSQLSALNIDDDTFTSIATNNTSLQPGFVIFLTFVLYGLILSEILKKITEKGITECHNGHNK